MNLRTLRELKGISRKDLAELTGVSFRSIQDYEQGHKELSSAKAETILKMAKALDCTMEDLISDVDLSCRKPSELGQPVWNSTENDDAVFESVSGGEARYTLMHKGQQVAELLMEPVTGALVAVTRVMDERLLPVGTGAGKDSLKAWWYRRAVPVTQGHIMKVLDRIGIITPQAFLLRSLGLSLTDDYWLKPDSGHETWDEVNLFDNDFEDLFGASHFDEFAAGVSSDKLDFRVPSAAVKGDVPKSWICMDGRRFLVKGTEKGRTQQIINEVVSAYIHRKQGQFDYVDYQFYTIDYGHGKQIGVSAEAFTSKELEFVSAADLIRDGRWQHPGASDYDIFVDACVNGGLERNDVEAFLDYQIMTDFVITNTDRNYDNFGVLRDSETLRFVKMAPVFDSGNSMFYDLDMSHGTLDLKNIAVNSFADNEIGLMRLVKDPSILDLNNLLTDEELGKVLASSNRTPEEVRVLVTVYDKKKEALFKLQRGDASWLTV